MRPPGTSGVSTQPLLLLLQQLGLQGQVRSARRATGHESSAPSAAAEAQLQGGGVRRSGLHCWGSSCGGVGGRWVGGTPLGSQAWLGALWSWVGAQSWSWQQSGLTAEFAKAA